MHKLFGMILIVVSSPLVAAPPQNEAAERADVWQVLQARYDQNRDGQITPDEYPRGRARFLSLDRNADDRLAPDDFAGADFAEADYRIEFRRMVAGRLIRAADQDGDGEVTRAEWQPFLATLAEDDETVIEPPELAVHLTRNRQPQRAARAARRSPLLRMIRMLDRDGNQQIQRADLQTVFNQLDRDRNDRIDLDEFGGGLPPVTAPQEGQVAPDFELAYAKDASRTVRLSGFANQRPVALIFGSYT